MTDEATPTAAPADDLFTDLDIPSSEPFDDGGAGDSPPAATPAIQPAPVAPEAPPTEGTPASDPAAVPAPSSPAEHQVPLNTLITERRKWQSDIENERNARLELQGRLAALEKPAAPPPETPAPDFLEDPKGYIDHQTKLAREAAEKAVAEANSARQRTDQQGAEQRFTQTLTNDEAAFSAKTTDYNAALNHVRGVRAQQLSLMYPQATGQQLQEALRREELTLAVQAMQQGRSPAETAYAYAKTLGYAGAVPSGAPSTTTPAVPLPKGATVTDIAAARQAAATTLGSGGGATGEGDPDGYEATEDPLDAALRERFKKR
jgi:hypothetical protein